MRRLVLLVAVLISSFLIYATQNALDRYHTPAADLNDILHLPDGKILKVISLGYNNLLADWLWIQTVLYFGKHTLDEDNPYFHILAEQAGVRVETETHDEEHEHEHEGEDFLAHLHENQRAISSTDSGLIQPPNIARVVAKRGKTNLTPYVYPLLWRVVQLDPHFLYPYIFGGFVVLHETGEAEEAYSLLQFGRQNNPDRWEFPFYLGYIELFFWQRPRMALRWLSEAMALPGHPPFLENLYIRVADAASQREFVVEYLKTMFQTAEDEKTRQEILKVLRRLGGRGE